MIRCRLLLTRLSGIFEKLSFHLLGEEPKLPKIAESPMDLEPNRFRPFLNRGFGLQAVSAPDKLKLELHALLLACATAIFG